MTKHVPMSKRNYLKLVILRLVYNRSGKCASRLGKLGKCLVMFCFVGRFRVFLVSLGNVMLGYVMLDVNGFYFIFTFKHWMFHVCLTPDNITCSKIVISILFK